MPRIGFLGPPGTFTEQALLSQDDLAAMELVPLPSIPDVLAATEAGDVDFGFVPMDALSVRVRQVSFEMALMLARASPRNPRVSIRSRSASSRILLVAWL